MGDGTHFRESPWPPRTPAPAPGACFPAVTPGTARPRADAVLSQTAEEPRPSAARREGWAAPGRVPCPGLSHGPLPDFPSPASGLCNGLVFLTNTFISLHSFLLCSRGWEFLPVPAQRSPVGSQRFPWCTIHPVLPGRCPRSPRLTWTSRPACSSDGRSQPPTNTMDLVQNWPPVALLFVGKQDREREASHFFTLGHQCII